MVVVPRTLDIQHDSMAAIKRQSELSELIRRTKLLIWDEDTVLRQLTALSVISLALTLGLMVTLNFPLN
jgi:hypothetical protein